MTFIEHIEYFIKQWIDFIAMVKTHGYLCYNMITWTQTSILETSLYTLEDQISWPHRLILCMEKLYPYKIPILTTSRNLSFFGKIQSSPDHGELRCRLQTFTFIVRHFAHLSMEQCWIKQYFSFFYVNIIILKTFERQMQGDRACRIPISKYFRDRIKPDRLIQNSLEFSSSSQSRS